MLRPSISNKLHIVTLSAFAFAQPLYDILGKNAEFFPVRNNETADILALILFLSLLIPSALVIFVEAARLPGKRTWELSHLAAIAVLVSIISLPVFKSITALNSTLVFGLACIAGLTFARLYSSKSMVRMFLNYLAPASLIFPLLFVFNSQVHHLIFNTEPLQPEITHVKSETPVVMIIFDELPVSTLMAAKDQIDEKLFPGFASLAQTATWYPNTATVAEYTIQAIPALLTGNMPPEKKNTNHPANNLNEWLNTPSYESHPRNLFTALGSNYELRVFETVSSMCPQSLCPDAREHRQQLYQRLQLLASDLPIVYLHLILPQSSTTDLPRIDMNWSDFVGNNFDDVHEHIKVDDINRFESFIDSLTPASRPALYFHHTTFPHTPWKYLPSGNVYEAHDHTYELTSEGAWTEHADLREPYQRHVLQSMFADRLLSKTLDKLRKEGIFDDAIIIVTSDHGASFQHGENIRNASQNNYADIMDVPLFIKHPHQRTASINTSQLQSIDIIPILFDALGEAYPWNTDGNTPTSNALPAHARLPIVSEDGEAKYINHDPDKKLETVDWKNSLFGNNGTNGVYGSADYAHLIGRSINHKCTNNLENFTITGANDGYIIVSPSSGKINSFIKIESPEPHQTRNSTIAISVNSKIAAILPATSISGDKNFAYTMLDENLLSSGKNTLSINTLKTSDDCNNYILADL